MDFLKGEPIFGLKNQEPEPDPGGPGGPRGTPGYVHMSVCPSWYPWTAT